ncbi:DUF2975 domain-containing protein [Streptococcus zalophi]|uniref:DUF2975 domain-containing protein n=1 Tax=Streptococcus zalophi TaxID=640031 RepID=UPI00215CCC38|nr:DUF2975 domain-containing protein [Streptococcus zalophi]MCR8967087.1 hypothetical protein [Streptococcus zalophi]
MQHTFYKTAKFFITLLKIFLYFFITVLIIGLMTFIFNWKMMYSLILREGILPDNSNIMFLGIIIMIAAILILFSVIYFLNMLNRLLLHFSNNEYFSETNINLLNKMMMSLLIWTGIQMVSAMLFNFIKVDNVSGVFEFHLKDYLINIILMAIVYLGKLVLKNGLGKIEELDQFI